MVGFPPAKDGILPRKLMPLPSQLKMSGTAQEASESERQHRQHQPDQFRTGLRVGLRVLKSI